MIIVPTRICNTNNCNYCSVYKKDFEQKYFLNFDLEDFFQKLILLSEKTLDYELRFFWWEAFLKFKTIKTIIDYIKTKTDKYNFVINTNLTILDEEKLNYILKNDIKLIISCNWKVNDHSKTRWVTIKQTLDLYKNIKLVTSYWIKHQINIVADNETAKNLRENLFFIQDELGGKNINLLPVNYNWWSDSGLCDLENSFNNILSDIKNEKLKIYFINKDINNEVLLFNSEFVIDSDWKVYPSMIILETFFEKQKNKILISDLNKSLDDFKNDISYFSIDDNKIYSLFINKFLENQFKDIIVNDYKSSELFHNFLIKI